MEVAVAFIGILIGWGLGFLTQLWMERRTAQRGARLVAMELLDNQSKLKQACETPVGDWPQRWVLTRTAWDAHATSVLGLVSEEENQQILFAYHQLNNAQRVLDSVWESMASTKQETDAEIDRLVKELKSAALTKVGKPQGRGESRDGMSAAVRQLIQDQRAHFASTVDGLQNLFAENRGYLDGVNASLRGASQLVWNKAYARAK